MTKIWREAWDSEVYTRALLHETGNPPGAYMDVNSCKPMKGRFPKTQLQILSEHPPTDFFVVGGMFIISKALKIVLEEFTVHAEFFPLLIEYQDKQYTERRFYFCNILDEVEAFDFEKGDYTFWESEGFTDHIHKIRKLVINEQAASAYHLFRMAKCSPDIVCVSDRLAERITESGFTGMKFVAPEEWSFC